MVCGVFPPLKWRFRGQTQISGWAFLFCIGGCPPQSWHICLCGFCSGCDQEYRGNYRDRDWDHRDYHRDRDGYRERNYREDRDYPRRGNRDGYDDTQAWAQKSMLTYPLCFSFVLSTMPPQVFGGGGFFQCGGLAEFAHPFFLSCFRVGRFCICFSHVPNSA